MMQSEKTSEFVPAFDGLITYSGRVNAWEIDVNKHWNSQFYLRSFQYGLEYIAQRLQYASLPTDSLITRHVRFHRELLLNESMRVTSYQGCEPHLLVHVLTAESDGKVAAVATDVTRYDLSALAKIDAEWYRRIGPRSLTLAPHPHNEAALALDAGQAIVSHCSILRPIEFDHNAALLMSKMHCHIGDGTNHLWQSIGITGQDFYQNQFGRAIVELKVSPQATATPGTAIRMVSWFSQIQERTFELRHQIQDLMTHEPIYDIGSVTLVIDQKARRSIPLPEFLRKGFAKLSH